MSKSLGHLSIKRTEALQYGTNQCAEGKNQKVEIAEQLGFDKIRFITPFFIDDIVALLTTMMYNFYKVIFPKFSSFFILIIFLMDSS